MGYILVLSYNYEAELIIRSPANWVWSNLPELQRKYTVAHLDSRRRIPADHVLLQIKYTFLVAIFLFELGSLICGIAPNSATLIGGRWANTGLYFDVNHL